MHRVRRLIVSLLVLLLSTPPTAVAQQPGPHDPNHDPTTVMNANGNAFDRSFFGWRDVTQRLEMSTDRVGVSFAEGTSFHKAARILEDRFFLISRSEEALRNDVTRALGRAPVNDFFEADTTVLIDCLQGASKAEIDETLKQLRDLPEVASATPVFRPRGYDKGESLLTNLLYVTVDAAHSVYSQQRKCLRARG